MEDAWTLAYGVAVTTKDDAVEALDARATLPEPPITWRDPLFYDALVGLAYARAERPGEALPYLERASKSCGALEQPILHTWTLNALGNALAATANAPKACEAYATVLARWGTSKSRTATEARSRSRASSCSR